MGSQRVRHDWATFTFSSPDCLRITQLVGQKLFVCWQHGLNVCVFPKFTCWSPTPLGCCIWSKKVIKVKWGPKVASWFNRTAVLIRRNPRELSDTGRLSPSHVLSLSNKERPCEDTLSQEKKALTRNRSSQSLNLRLAASITVKNKYLSLKPPRLWHFVLLWPLVTNTGRL